MAASAVLQGCAALGVSASPTFADRQFAAHSVELTATPFFPSEDHQCGPSALATLLGQSGAAVAPEALATEIYLPAREGTLSIELTAAVRRHDRLPEVLPPRLDAISAALGQGHAVLVLQNLGLDWLPRWHYATVIGYDAAHDEVLLRSGKEARQALPGFTFEHTWSRSARFALIALRADQPPLFTGTADWLRTLADTHASPLAWQTATTRWPDAAAAWFGLGNAWLAQGAPQAAEQAFRQALVRDPNFLPATNNLAMLLAGRGDRSAALQLLDQALQALPPDGSAMAAAGSVALRTTLLRTRAEVAGEPAALPNADSNGLH